MNDSSDGVESKVSPISITDDATEENNKEGETRNQKVEMEESTTVPANLPYGHGGSIQPSEEDEPNSNRR
jgi:hypothetical protein